MRKRLLIIILIILPLGRLLNHPLMETAGKVLPLSPFDVFLGMLFIAYIPRLRAICAPNSALRPLITRFSAFALWSAITLPLNAVFLHIGASQVAFSGLYLLRWIEYFILAVAAYDVASITADERRRIAKWLFVGALVFAIFGIIQAATLPDFALLLNPDAKPYIDYDPQGHRLVSTFLDPNIAAGYLVLFAILAFSLHISGNPRWFPVFLILTAAVLLTLSRGGVLGLVVGLVSLTVWRRRGGRTLVAAMGTVGLVALVVYPFISPYLTSLQRISVTDESAMMRVQDWIAALSMIRDKPLTGIGFNTFGFVAPAYGLEREGGMAFGFPGDFLLILTLTGAIGFALYLRIYTYCFGTAKSNIANTSDTWEIGFASGLRSGILAMMVCSCFTTILLYPHIMAVTWVALGLLYSTVKQNRKDDVISKRINSHPPLSHLLWRGVGKSLAHPIGH